MLFDQNRTAIRLLTNNYIWFYTAFVQNFKLIIQISTKKCGKSAEVHVTIRLTCLKQKGMARTVTPIILLPMLMTYGQLALLVMVEPRLTDTTSQVNSATPSAGNLK